MMGLGSPSLFLKLGGAVAAGAVVATAAGCASSGSSSASAPASSSAPAAASAAASSGMASSSAASTATPAAATSAAGGSSSPAAAPAGALASACKTANLKVTTANSEGAAGSTYTNIDFTNTGSASCTLYGYPGVSLAAGSSASQVGAAAQRSATGRPTVVTLKPGATGNALLRVTQALNYPSSACSPKDTTLLRVYPPNQTTSVTLAFKAMGCAKESVKLLTVGVVQTGAMAQQ